MELLDRLSKPDWWIEKCLTDLYFLCRNVLCTLEDPTQGFKDLYRPTHYRLCSFVERYAEAGHSLIILMPRGWIKSYVVTIGWTIQQILRHLVLGTRQHCIISNATIDNSLNFLKKIKYNFQYNDFLRGLFSEYLPADPANEAEEWTKEYIQLGGNLVETGSVEGNLVSRHYAVMIHDDLVNLDNSKNYEQIAKVIDWWKLARSLQTAQGLEIIIGTRWKYEDLYGHMIDKFIQPTKKEKEAIHEDSFVELHRGKYHLLNVACWENRELRKGSTFPILYPEEKLKEIELEQEERFGGQYLNDPLEMSDAMFKKKWMKSWREHQIPETRLTIMTVDPCLKEKEGSDYTGITVTDAGSDKVCYIRYCAHRRLTDKKACRWIFETMLDWQPYILGIEDQKFGTFVELLELLIPQWIRRKDFPERFKDDNGNIPSEIVEYALQIPSIAREVRSRGRSKFVRVENLTGFFEDGRFLLPPSGYEDLKEELLRYPASKYDDIADALAYTMDLLRFPDKKDPKKTLLLPESLKKTDKQREIEDWEQYRQDCFESMTQIEREELEFFGD